MQCTVWKPQIDQSWISHGHRVWFPVQDRITVEHFIFLFIYDIYLLPKWVPGGQVYILATHCILSLASLHKEKQNLFAEPVNEFVVGECIFGRVSQRKLLFKVKC
jgi:hypothetical protein